MADSTTNITQLSSSQASKEITVNALVDAGSPALLYGRNAFTTTGLTWGYYGGRLNGTSIANGTVALSASQTNYVVAARSTGVVSVATATTNWDDRAAYIRLYKVVTGASTITSYEDHRDKEPIITAGTSAQYFRGDKTWRDFATDVRASVLTGLSTAAGTVVTAAHTVLEAIGFLQKQVSDNTTAIALKANAANAALTGTTTAETLNISAGLSVSGSAGNVYSSTSTPTLTNTTNISSSTASGALQYTRVGNVVHFAAPVSITPTAIGAIELQISLPISSNFTSSLNAIGTAVSRASTSTPQQGIIEANATDDTLKLSGYAASTSANIWFIHGSYRVL